MKDATLGGYVREHERPPAFEGGDGDLYTVEIITDRAGAGDGGDWGAYLLFLRWRGNQPIGHIESGFLAEAGDEATARAAVEELTLLEVKKILDDLVLPDG